MTSADGSVIYFHNKVECKVEPFYAFESVSFFAIDHIHPPNSGHLIVFFRVHLNESADKIQLALQSDEVNGAAWLSFEDMARFLKREEGDKEVNGLIPMDSNGLSQHTKFKLAQFFPNYPNEFGEGISKAHNFAIRHMMKTAMQPDHKL